MDGVKIEYNPSKVIYDEKNEYGKFDLRARLTLIRIGNRRFLVMKLFTTSFSSSVIARVVGDCSSQLPIISGISISPLTNDDEGTAISSRDPRGDPLI